MQEIIIDTDAGVDDAVAILMALNWPGAEILAITTVAGNVAEPQVAINVAKILAYTGCTNIPIYRGCETPIIGSRAGALTWAGHGMDGFGDVPEELLGLSGNHHELVPDKVSILSPSTSNSSNGSNGNSSSNSNGTSKNSRARKQHEHAALALIRLLHSHPNATLVMIGPLTNLALALRLDPTLEAALSNRPNRLVIMGGSLTGSGNVSLTAEYNFHEDPEAAHIVLSSCKRPESVIIVPLEFCREQSLNWSHFDQIVAHETVFAKLLNLITKPYLKTCRQVVHKGNVSAVATARVKSNYLQTQTAASIPQSNADATDSDNEAVNNDIKEAISEATNRVTETLTRSASASASASASVSVSASANADDNNNNDNDGTSIGGGVYSSEEAVYDDPDDGRFTPYDAFAIAVALEPQLVTKKEVLYATIELGGVNTRGMLVCDWNKRSNKPPNVTAARLMNSTRIEEIMMNSFCS